MIATLREQLATLIETAAVPAHRTVPEQVQPPCYVLQAAERFVRDDDPDATFAEPYVITFEIMALVPLDDEHDNEQATELLDDMIGGLLNGLRGTEWQLESMGRPGGLATTQWLAHGQRVNVKRTTNL